MDTAKTKKKLNRHHHFIVLLCTIVFILVTGCGPAAPKSDPSPTNSLTLEESTAVSITATTEDATATPTTTPSPTNTPKPLEPSLLLLTDRGEGMIAYTLSKGSNADIYVMNADGSNQTQLTDDPAYDAWPSWSPDGSQIAFMSERNGNPDIYVMDADGSNLRQLTDHPANDIWPEWSPDGTRIAFPSRRDGNFEIYVINADGTNLQRLTNTPGHEDFPAWSTDGSRIVYVRSEIDEGTYVMNADGSGEMKLFDFPIFEPAWSPDGRQIAFGSDHEGFRGIYVMDPDGGNLKLLSETRAGENCPSWSPDGTQIVFASWRDHGYGEIYIMDADGNSLERLTNNRWEEEYPAWRPIPRVKPIEVRTYGGELNDAAYDILLLADGGTLIVGRANNTGLSHRITPGTARLIRTDSEGNVIWQKDYGGEIDTMFYSPIQTGEDEYVVLGQIAASYTREENDFYLMKIDGEGNEIWSRTYGGRGMDTAKMVRQTADGGFIMVGGRADEFPTNSSSGYLYQGDIVLIKTDAEGNEIWTQTYGDKILYLGWGVAQTPDGGYVLIGWEAKTYSDRDVIAIKTDEIGNVEWSRTWDLDPNDRDGGFDLILTADGHIVIAGVQSMDTGVRGAVLIKVDLDGNEIWVKVLGKEGVDNEFWDILEDADGGYVMDGATLSGNYYTTGGKIRRGLIVKTDSDGETLWQYVFDAEEYELTHFSSAVTLPDGGYIFVGQAVRKGETYLDMLWLKISGEEFSKD